MNKSVQRRGAIGDFVHCLEDFYSFASFDSPSFLGKDDGVKE